MKIISDFFFSVQFPVFDNRPLLYEDTFKLNFPTPSPLLKKDFEFLRNFGQIRYRSNRESLPYLDEETFCQCNNLLKFPLLEDNPNNYFNNSVYQIKKLKTYRRFYSDGKISLKFEVIFVFQIQHAESLPLKENILMDLISKLTELPVRLYSDKTLSIKLIDIGKKLAETYLNSTTKTNSKLATKKWWVTNGEPVLFIQTIFDFVPPIFKKIGTKEISNSQYKHLKIYNYVFISKSQKKILIWLCPSVKDKNFTDLKTRYQYIREIKILIFRHYGYLQFLKNLFSIVVEGNLNFQRATQQSDMLQKFLIDIHKFLKGDTTNGEDSLIKRQILKINSFLPNIERESLIQKLETFDFRPNTLAKTVELINEQDFEERKENTRLKLKKMIGSSKIALFFDILTEVSSFENTNINDVFLFQNQYHEIEKEMQENTAGLYPF